MTKTFRGAIAETFKGLKVCFDAGIIKSTRITQRNRRTMKDRKI
jgi:hypothetical protein